MTQTAGFSHPKKTVMIHTTIRTGKTMVRTMPVTVLHAMTWNRMVLRAHMAMARMKSGSEPDKEMPILEFSRVTSSMPGRTFRYFHRRKNVQVSEAPETSPRARMTMTQ